MERSSAVVVILNDAKGVQGVQRMINKRSLKKLLLRHVERKVNKDPADKKFVNEETEQE